jgi:hypothetical protein
VTESVANDTVRAVRWTSLAALASWGLLVALQLGWIPFARYAWAFNLWGYFPGWVAVALGGAALLLCFGPVRATIIQGATLGGAALARLPRGAALLAGLLGLAVAAWLLWLLRERYIAGDSALLVMAVHGGWTFVFQEPGASFLMHHAVAAAESLRFGPLNGVRVLSCLCSVPAFFFLFGAARNLGAPGFAGAIVLFVLSGGLIRVFAGHVEVYAPLLAAASGYLWAALAYLRQRAPWWAPALALGMTVWMHVSAVALVPSLLLLPWLVSERPREPRPVLRALTGAALSGVPVLVFLALLLVFGYREDVQRAADKALEVLGRSSELDATRWWVRGWGSYPSVGTDVVFLSWPHLKYLLNAAHLLAPATLPLLAGFAVARRRLLVQAPAARFLLAAAIPLVAYSCLLRPFWGPFDWDLFSLTALVLSLLAAHLVATGLAPGLRAHLVVWLVGFQLAFVAIPFVATGLGKWRDAGPFQPRQWTVDLRMPNTPAPAELEPWL